MMGHGTQLAGAIALAIFIADGRLSIHLHGQGRATAEPPAFKVDPLWPKPLPNHWILGSVTGIWVDAQDHVWLVHRGLASLTARTEAGLATDPPTAETCCAPAPPVLEFDQAGNLVSHWGGSGPNHEWPQSPGGMTVDSKGHVWIAAAGLSEPTAGRGRPAPPEGTPGPAPAPATGAAPAAAPPPQDAHVLKFTRAGAFVMQIGKAGAVQGNGSTTGLNRPADVEVDVAANEVYIADGMANQRVAVFDATTGAYKRHWGAYGQQPGEASSIPYDPAAPPSKQFNTVSCVRIAADGLVYVCDRRNDRVQVFQKNGKFVREGFVSKSTRGEGSVWDVAFSRDPQQRFLFVADGQDQKIFVLRRETLEVVSSFGAGGRWPGHFYGVGSIAVDSRGNVYTGETFEGKRLQKFAPQNPGSARGGRQ